MLIAPDPAALRGWFEPEAPGPLVGPHVIHSGYGKIVVDRWPDPRVVVAETGGNYTLHGDTAFLSVAEVREHVNGFVAAPDTFERLLREAFPSQFVVWDRVIFELPTAQPLAPPNHAEVRPLHPGDTAQLEAIEPDSAWIANTWGGPAGLAGSGYAWGAFVDERLVSVACSFFLGQQFEDLGVVTEIAHRGRGLSLACAAGLCADIRTRGRVPSWTTSPDNVASRRVAEKLGFALHRNDRLFVVGRPVPEPARDS